ncbi:MAG: hypothetical protein A2Y15_09230 [Clostridiales bacterium GWF2_36_10]|nr:MAG: hypothetical protein A2Y15_09230 [Clostridiales bacterium GWF2_36_10]HAN21438.1 hypothetical protein [Clostridiales bacterium]
MPEDANSLYLKELLKQADIANEQARLYERTKINDTVKPVPQQGINFAVKPSAKLHNTGRICDEAAEIISVYTKKEKEKPFSNTQSLRDSLAFQMQENKELLGYFDNNKVRSRSSKVEELYSLIHHATTATISDAEVSSPTEVDKIRLVDSSTVPQKVTFPQEKMFYFGDTQEIDDEPVAKTTASFDSDYEKLTEKITSGEISFDNEEEDEHQVAFMDDEADKLAIKDEDGEPLDETDINLRLAFNMMDESRYDIDEFLKKEKEKVKNHRKKLKLNKGNEYEYTSREQNSEINIMLKKAINHSRFKLISVIIFAFAIFYLELATKDSVFHSVFFKPGRYGILYILIDLQLLFFSALVMISNIKNGLSGIFKLKLNTDSMFTISFIFTAAYSFVMLFTDPTSAELKLYGFPCAVAAVCAITINYQNNKKDYHCFRVLASKKTKYAASELDNSAKEADEFYKYLLENSDLYTVKKTNFVSGFFTRTKKRAKGEDLFNFLIPSILLAGVVLFAVMYMLGSDLRTSFLSFSLLITTSVPLSSFFMIPLPIIAANKKGAKCNSAFIGNAVSEEYADASVMSFADTEVYPAHLVKITSLRTYGDYRIDKIIPDMAKVFAFIGGPLEKVFAGVLGDSVAVAKSIRLIESAADGICVAVDGTHIFLGKKSYMRRYRFETPGDPDDDMYEKSVGSIMYVVLNESLAAKVYIKYTLNPLFDSLLKDMYKAGMCLGIKTLDPNINNELLASGIKFKKCPIAILKAGSPEDMNGECQSIDSGIVSNASLHTFLKMFVVCDKARHVTKSNAIITIASVFLSFFAAFFLSITGDASAISSYYMVILQMIWLVPVWITSYFI